MIPSNGSKCLTMRKCIVGWWAQIWVTAAPLALPQHSQDEISLSLRQMSPIAFPPPSLAGPVESRGHFLPASFLHPTRRSTYVLLVTRLVSVHRREDRERRRKGRGMSYPLPAACEMSPILSLLSPSKSLAEKRIAVAVVDSVFIHRVLVSNIPGTVLLRQTQQLPAQ